MDVRENMTPDENTEITGFDSLEALLNDGDSDGTEDLDALIDSIGDDEDDDDDWGDSDFDDWDVDDLDFGEGIEDEDDEESNDTSDNPLEIEDDIDDAIDENMIDE